MNINKEKEIAIILAGIYAKYMLLPDDQERLECEKIFCSILRGLGFLRVRIFKHARGYSVEIENIHTAWKFPITNKGDIIK